MRPPTVILQTSIYERPISKASLPASVFRQATHVEVGITWECGGCDLDLYGQRQSGSTAIWLLNTQTPDGQSLRDFRTSHAARTSYETLAYHVPVDLNHLLLAVNFYNGSSPGGVKGEVRISLNGHTYAMPFHVLAQEGNGKGGKARKLSRLAGQTIPSGSGSIRWRSSAFERHPPSLLSDKGETDCTPLHSDSNLCC